MATFDVTSSGTVVVEDGDTVEINISNGGTVTIQADPDDGVDKVKIKFLNDGHSDTAIIDLSTFSEDDLHIDIEDYDPSDIIQLPGAFNFYVDPDDEDEFTFSYTGADGGTYTGFIHAKDKDEKDFTDPFQPITIICFGSGTMIDTPDGPVRVEDLAAGDRVLTLDNGAQPLRWIGRRRLDRLTLARHTELRPIIVRAHAFGLDRPGSDLVLSPQHRVLLTDWRAEILFGEPEVLVAAKHMVDDRQVLVDRDADHVTYHHLLFDAHEIVLANGLPTESLYAGSMAIGSLEDAAYRELVQIFPEVATLQKSFGETARAVLRSYEGCAVNAA